MSGPDIRNIGAQITGNLIGRSAMQFMQYLLPLNGFVDERLGP